MGGKGTKKHVHKIIEEKTKNRFNDLDFGIVKDNRTKRWEKNVDWQRYKMVIEGLLCSNSPHGIWEITEQGKEYLRKFSHNQ